MKRNLAILVAVLALCGCSGTAGPTEGPGAGGPSQAPAGGASQGPQVTDSGSFGQSPAASMPVPAGLVDPCALASAADIGSVMNATFQEGQRSLLEDGTYVDCAWYEPTLTHPELGTPLDIRLEPKTSDNTSYIGSGGGVDQIPGITDAAQISKKSSDPLHGAQVDGYKGAIKFTIRCSLPGALFDHPTPSAYDNCILITKAVAARLP